MTMEKKRTVEKDPPLKKDDLIVITGSVFLAGELRPMLIDACSP